MSDPEKLPPLYEQYLDDLEASTPKPWNDASRTCEMDGYQDIYVPGHDYTDYYWHCEQPAVFRAVGYVSDMDHEHPTVMYVCTQHAEEFDHVTPIEERHQ